jgi:TonB-dependent starch-binding outer membrane protein SusC
MEKNLPLPVILPGRQYRKILRIMKLTILLLIASLINVTAAVFPQGSKFNFDMKNVSVKEVLAAVEKNSSYKFLYRNEFINVEEKVDITAKDESLDAIMVKLFSSKDVVYRVFEGDLVVITDKSLQQAKISGRVTDSESGDPLVGVNILVKGTSTGAITDLDGKYSVEVVGSNPILEFSFVGYTMQSIAVSGQSVIDVKMVPDIKNLDEVIVVGYGVQKKSDVTGSVTSVGKDRLGEIPVTNILHAIEGSTAGLTITQTSSVPGSSGNIQIRGVNSINANTQPFIVLDGVPFWGTTNDINPNDIESIEILKDASAVAIYGTRGANGVILITSKRGKKDQTKPIIASTLMLLPELKSGQQHQC